MILILDIDGTLSDSKHRAHYVDNKAKPDWESFLQPNLVALDTVVQDSQRGVRLLTPLVDKIIFLTGRNERLREITTTWLKTHFGIDCNQENLLMRPLDSEELPTVFKSKVLEKLKIDNPNQNFMAIDDDKFMMKVYRDFGMLTLQAPDIWKYLFPDFDHLTNETTWRK